jgi:hypothetical protein
MFFHDLLISPSINMRSEIVVELLQIQNYADTFVVKKYCWVAFWIM